MHDEFFLQKLLQIRCHFFPRCRSQTLLAIRVVDPDPLNPDQYQRFLLKFGPDTFFYNAKLEIFY